MAISALPPSTTRLLGSSVVITNPVSLVKELVDNGIDAGATSIEVTISPNTVDKIHVRDNGQGIRVDDFDLLGRRAHTSKLRKFEELETKGGQTLGFRGEALASVNSLATVKIITRTAQDPVASLVVLRFGDGGVERKQPWSAPTGTTVHALKLFDNLPVRKQTALKESRKTLMNVKRLLETYALTLPRLRLSLKVPGDSHQAWSYSPCSSSDTREAVTQIFGRSLAAQCVEVTRSLSTGNTETLPGSAWGTLTALLPKPDAQFGEIKNKGSFISIDSRPILSSRGIGKKITAILRRQLTGALGLSEPPRSSLSSPFMRLNIECQPGSYDTNVSPLKDEVIFKEEQVILDCFQALCDQVYKPRDSPSRVRTRVGSKIQDDNLSKSTMPPTSGQPSEPEKGSQCRPGSRLSINIESTDIDADNFLIDDLELLEVLSSVELETSGPSGTVLQDATGQGNQLMLGCAQANDEEPDPADNPKTVPIMMRMVSKVNLARTGSNTSDEGCTIGLVPVQVAPRHKSPPTTNQDRSGVEHNDSAPARHLKGIGRYFQSKRDPPIEIALDETATLGILHNREESNICETTRQHEIGRQPLKELTDSMLNALQGDNEEEESEAMSDFSSPEPETLQPHNTPRGDLMAPLTERGLGIAAEEVAVVPIQFSANTAIDRYLATSANVRHSTINPRPQQRTFIKVPDNTPRSADAARNFY
ncbi:hypothetical protein G7Z17_g8063 [Cylindrodendrum hubeiense]|uniref:DNA mismatch repair protein S5 domain-containing protein n=1 Tax=Cylindrodendrum hubeiense TaxID=595255 RepID=A0A9P5LEQ3_9HYPO|nr:hypothetical protein G7Z17_g8063 [Cylindrodendrum hubeiense]